MGNSGEVGTGTGDGDGDAGKARREQGYDGGNGVGG